MNSYGPMHFSNNVDGVIYWVVYDLLVSNNRIISLDLSHLTIEEFRRVDLLDSLAGLRYLDISKLKEFLVMLDSEGDA